MKTARKISWKARVKATYDSLEQLRDFDRVFNIAKRCGYRSAKKLWEDNPIIGGSTNPNDFGVV